MFRKHLEAFINERLPVAGEVKPEPQPADPRTPAALATLRAQVRSGGAWKLNKESLRLILSHTPRSIQEYQLARIAEWSQARYAIDKRFTPLTLLLDQGEQQAPGPRWQAQRQYDDLRKVLAEVNEPALVVLGPPGCGKSTLLQRLELDLAVAALKNQGEAAPISIFLPLNRYRFQGGARLSPRKWIAHEWERHGTGLAPFETVLRQGKLVLLLDGVNEMPHAGEADYAERIALWRESLVDLSRTAPGTRVVFSCRELDYSATLSTPGLRVPHVRIERLGDAQVEEFLSLYSPEHGPRLWKELKGTPQLDLFRSPYYLSLLLAQAGAGGPALTGRAALFTNFVRQALLREIVNGATLFRSGELLDHLDHQQVVLYQWRDTYDLPARSGFLSALAKFAFDLQRRHAGSELAQVRTGYDAALAMLGGQQADKLLRGAVALQGLDWQLGQVYFVHQLLQEYFAARFAITQPAEVAALARTVWRADAIVPSLAAVLQSLAEADPLPAAPATGWEETFLLAAAMAPRPEKWVRALVSVNLPLAGRCAAQPDVKVSGSLRDEIRHALVARRGDPAADLRARIAAGRALGDLGDPRFERRTGQHGAYLLPPMIAIPGGRYSIGSDDELEDDEAPRHELALSGFALARFPVTNAEYRRFIEAGGYEDERWWAGEAARRWRRGEGTADGPKRQWRERRVWFKQDAERLGIQLREGRMTTVSAQWWERHLAMPVQEFESVLDGWYPSGRQTQPASWNDPACNQSSQPVVGISWHEARAYCAWLSAQTGKTYRLPREVEWEAAARGKEARAYPWGEQFDSARCNTFASHVRGTTPVGVFPNGETPDGLVDMSGNVWEWTSSLYRPYPCLPDDGRDVAESADELRALRGGSWGNNDRYARCADRYRHDPGYRFNNIGFRLCCAPSSGVSTSALGPPGRGLGQR